MNHSLWYRKYAQSPLEENTYYKTFEVVNDDYVEIVAEGTIYWSLFRSRFYFIPSSRASQVPLHSPILMVSSQVQVQFKKFKITFTISPFCKSSHESFIPFHCIFCNKLFILTSIFSFSFSSSIPCSPNKLGCSNQTRFTWCAKQLLSRLTQQITSLGD